MNSVVAVLASRSQTEKEIYKGENGLKKILQSFLYPESREIRKK